MGVFVLLLVVLVAAVWFQREQIADSFIADTFAQNDIDATYTVESISPQQQVLTDIVIGDPAAPDLTIERLELSITPRFGIPDLNELRLIRPRLYGSYRDGQLSFGELDPLLFTGEEGPVELPDLNLVIEDGRGLLETDYGRVGVKIGGGGNLQDGFSAEVAAVAAGTGAAGVRHRRANALRHHFHCRRAPAVRWTTAVRLACLCGAGSFSGRGHGATRRAGRERLCRL